MSVNGTHVEDKMRKIKGDCAHFSFNKCPIYTHDGASTKLGNNSLETDNSVLIDFVAEVFKHNSESLSCFFALIVDSSGYKFNLEQTFTNLRRNQFVAYSK